MKRLIPAVLLLLYSYSVPLAQTDWTPAKRLTWTPGDSYKPAIAVDSAYAIHIVWYDGTPGNLELYYMKSTNGGTTWSVPRRLTWTADSSVAPALAIDSSDTIHLAWSDRTPGNYEIYYMRSPDGGASWSTARRLTWTSGDSWDYPAIDTGSGNSVYIAWSDYTPGSFEVFYLKSTNGGITWSTDKRLTWTLTWSLYPAIVVDSSDVIHAVWQDDAVGNQEVYYKRSPDGGTSWTAAKRLTWSAGDSSFPAIAADSDNSIHAVWEEWTSSGAEIHYRRSLDGGTNWSGALRLTWTSANSYDPTVGIDRTHGIHVVWYDGAPSDDIFYKRSADGGTNWSGTQRLSWNSGWSEFPALAIDLRNTIYVAWDDDTPGSEEIYYRKGTNCLSCHN